MQAIESGQVCQGRQRVVCNCGCAESNISLQLPAGAAGFRLLNHLHMLQPMIALAGQAFIAGMTATTSFKSGKNLLVHFLKWFVLSYRRHAGLTWWKADGDTTLAMQQSPFITSQLN